MRRLLAALSLCLFLAACPPYRAEAKPSHYPPVTQFNGDRYASVAQGGTTARDITRRAACPPLCKQKPRKPKLKRKPAPGYVHPVAAAGEMTMAGGLRREVGSAVSTVIGGRPAGCPRRFCGCALAIKIFGRIIPTLNLAANWMRFPRTEPAPGMVAARRGHVFKLLAHVHGRTWQVWDANSGRGRIRIHHRSIAGYTIVDPRRA